MLRGKLRCMAERGSVGSLREGFQSEPYQGTGWMLLPFVSIRGMGYRNKRRKFEVETDILNLRHLWGHPSENPQWAIRMYSNALRPGIPCREMSVGITDIRSLHVNNDQVKSSQSVLIIF